MEKSMDLVDRLYSMVGCEYLSDLKDPERRSELLRAIGTIKMKDYTLQQWSLALSYLWKEEISIDSEKCLQAFLKEQDELIEGGKHP